MSEAKKETDASAPTRHRLEGVFLTLLVGKALGYDLSWWTVFAPFWVLLGFCAIVLIIALPFIYFENRAAKRAVKKMVWGSLFDDWERRAKDLEATDTRK